MNHDMFILGTDSYLQAGGLGVFNGVVDNLLDHTEDMDLDVFRHNRFFHNKQFNLQGLLVTNLGYKLSHGFDQPLSFKRIWQQVI